ncbi:MAG: hypothetical protein K6F57_00695 [Candidatus Saccharibacteria bacterium]|nr:hypothetical protein [Candidatus Saccharibacteria bacterium]
MSPEFEPIFEYTFDEKEAFYAATPLKDRSVVGVGLSTTATVNYPINSDGNGIYYRWIDNDVPVLTASGDEKTNDNSTENPNTLDDIIKNSFTLIGLVGFILAIISRQRR